MYTYICIYIYKCIYDIYIYIYDMYIHVSICRRETRWKGSLRICVAFDSTSDLTKRYHDPTLSRAWLLSHERAHTCARSLSFSLFFLDHSFFLSLSYSLAASTWARRGRAASAPAVGRRFIRRRSPARSAARPRQEMDQWILWWAENWGGGIWKCV